MALVQIGKNHDNDIKKLKGRINKIEKHKGSSHATIKLKVEDHKNTNLNSTIANLKKKIKDLEKKKHTKKKVVKKIIHKKSVKKKTAKKVTRKRAKPKLKKSSIEKHKHDLKKIKEKLSKLEQKKRNATIKPTLSFRTTINKLSKRIDAIFNILEKAHEDINGDGSEENPFIKKLDLILEQNEKIAQGILTVAGMIKDKNEIKDDSEEIVQSTITEDTMANNSQTETNNSKLDIIQPINENPISENQVDQFDVEQSAPFANIGDEAQANEMQPSASMNEINAIEEPFRPVNISSQDTNITQVNHFAEMKPTPIPDFQNPQMENLQPVAEVPVVNEGQNDFAPQEQPREIFNPDTAVVENSPLESQMNVPISDAENSNIKGLFGDNSSDQLNDLNDLYTPPKEDTIELVEQAKINIPNQNEQKPFANVNNQNAPAMDVPQMAPTQPLDTTPMPTQPMDAPPMAPTQPMDAPPMPTQPMDAPPMMSNIQQPQPMSQDSGLAPVSELINPNSLNSNMQQSMGVPQVNEQVTPIQSNTAPIPPTNSNEKIQLKSFNNNNG
jgi:hypothetical protein